MFTGIIEEVGRLNRFGTGTIDVRANIVVADVHIGDSIAVNGICLTVTSFDKSRFTADVMPETIRRTSLAGLQPGAMLNLERAVLPTTRMGGHFVSGHIDDVGTITSMREEGNAIWLKITAGANILRGIVPKGSVALDGISLTVAEVGAEDFTVSLIPHTRSVTNLSRKKVGSLINIETDILGKYVERMLAMGSQNSVNKETGSQGLTAAFLAKHGF